MMSMMRWTSLAFANSSSGLARAKSTKKLPLLGLISIASSFGFAFLLLTPFRIVLLRGFKAFPNQLDLLLRRPDTLLRLLLKDVKGVHHAGESHRVDLPGRCSRRRLRPLQGHSSRQNS